MPINDMVVPTPTRLTLMDQAVVFYHSLGLDFVELLDQYISAFPEAKRYTFIGPDYFLLGHEETRIDPNDPEPRQTEPYWYISYMASGREKPLLHFMRLMPYPLDRVGFLRYAKYPDRGMRFLETAKLMRFLNYGLKT